MDGHYLPSLLRVYRQQQVSRATRLDVLCVQETIAPCRIAAALGHSFSVASNAGDPRLAIVYDRSRLRPVCVPELLPLPRLTAVPAWQRLYTSGMPEQKYALISTFAIKLSSRRRLPSSRRSRQYRYKLGRQIQPRARTRRPCPAHNLMLVNFHLDAAGDNAHRAAQLKAITMALTERSGLLDGTCRGAPSLIACGDTNAFSFDAAEAGAQLTHMLTPLCQTHDAVDAHGPKAPPTHFFARANEPNKLGQQIAVAAGRMGIDFPRRYDVVVSSLPVRRSGNVTTEESDHDLVWATLSFSLRRTRSRAARV